MGSYLVKAGYQVVDVDVDPYFTDEARRQLPNAMWLVGDLAQLSHVSDDGFEDILHDDAAFAFDVIICPGNVLTLAAPEDRVKVLQAFTVALDPEDGRVIIGFGAGRGQDLADLEATAQETELIVIQHCSTQDLRPFEDESQFLVAMPERR